METAMDIIEYDNNTKVIITMKSKDGIPTIEEYWYKNDSKGLVLLRKGDK